jgi:hypothetical protein
MTGAPLDAAGYIRFAALADVLIAGGHGLPSAGAAPGFEDSVRRVLVARPDLSTAVAAVIAESGARDDVVRELDPARFEAFAYTVAAAYLMTPTIRRLLGYPGNAPRPEPPHDGEAEYYLEGGLLDPVLTRGPIYRCVPDEG